jgi:hypothetical protein
VTALVLGHAWWRWQETAAHARKPGSRQAKAVCGHRLAPKACYRISTDALCGECVAIITGLRDATEAAGPHKPAPEGSTPSPAINVERGAPARSGDSKSTRARIDTSAPRLPPPANPWMSCPCGEYRFRLYSNDERTGKDGRWHSVLVCQRKFPEAA